MSLEAALEITLAGPTLQALHPTACVLFGAQFDLSVNEHAVRMGATFSLNAGDILQIGGTTTGVRGYLCVAGGFTSPIVLGSRSALEPIQVGDTLVCPPSQCQTRSMDWSGALLPASLRVLDGPQRDWFTDDTFFTQRYTVSPASNRMGIRFQGTPLCRRPGELASEAVAPGAVQVTNDGLPVVLGVDGQTIGGYPKIAHVIRADLDSLAQLRPGAVLRFQRVTMEEATTAAVERAAERRHWLTRLRTAERAPVILPET
jgi:antagonist of KipI